MTAGAAAWRGGVVAGAAAGPGSTSALGAAAALAFASLAAFCIPAAFAASGDCGAVAELSAAVAAAGVCCGDTLLSGEPTVAVPVGEAASFGASAAGCAGGRSAGLFESVVVTVSLGSAGNNIL